MILSLPLFSCAATGGFTTNVNIFDGILSESKMKEITNGSKCGLAGTFLAWDPENYNLTHPHVGNATIPLKKLCHLDISSNKILDPMPRQIWKT